MAVRWVGGEEEEGGKYEQWQLGGWVGKWKRESEESVGSGS